MAAAYRRLAVVVAAAYRRLVVAAAVVAAAVVAAAVVAAAAVNRSSVLTWTQATPVRRFDDATRPLGIFQRK